MKKVKFGIIGLGVMGNQHLKTLQTIEKCEVTAVCDIDPRQIEKVRKDKEVTLGFAAFNDYRKLIDSGLCEAVAVVTPHPVHLEISEYAFGKGMHVMCDKPITITVAEADRMLAAWEKAGTKFSTMYSMRTTSMNKVIKRMVGSGELGNIYRVEMTCTQWLRTQTYYDSQSWRGSWKGEGGGLLMNQAPHNLDLLYWWFGPAAKVRADVMTRAHDIETEDEVNATIWTEGGFPIHFYSNTGEAPGRDYLEIVADNGTVVRENGKVIFKKLPEKLSSLIKDSGEFMPEIKFNEEEVEIPELPRGHKIVFESFINNILNELPNSEQEAPGNEGIHAVEWANAMLLSSIKKREMSLPLNRQEYNQLLNDFQNNKQKL